MALVGQQETSGASGWRRAVVNRPVLASALGNFAATYDLVLFSIVRIPSLQSMGVTGADLTDKGFDLLDLQMTGMLLGGLLWGVIADRFGRLPVLFLSTALYSIINIYNAFITSVDAYSVLRFLAGLGMAGELGASITLISETLPKETRGYGTSFVVGIGVSGAILAAVVTQHTDWETGYLLGGLLGLVGLAARLPLGESAMYEGLRTRKDVVRGRLDWFFNNAERFRRLAHCTLVGMPMWFVIGILITFAPEICRALGATEQVSAGSGILSYYVGLTLGSLSAGWLSQRWRSRRKAAALLLALTCWLFAVFVLIEGAQPPVYYGLFGLMGLFSGFWALFVAIPAEQFGTNLRGTATIAIPNIIRGSVVLLTWAVHQLSKPLGLVPGVVIVGAVCFALSLLGVWRLSESFGRDLDFVER